MEIMRSIGIVACRQSHEIAFLQTFKKLPINKNPQELKDSTAYV